VPVRGAALAISVPSLRDLDVYEIAGNAINRYVKYRVDSRPEVISAEQPSGRQKPRVPADMPGADGIL
jgi:hypothetical protein